MPPAEVSALNVSLDLRGMLGQCWDEDPSSRPGIGKCITTLESTSPQLAVLGLIGDTPFNTSGGFCDVFVGHHSSYGQVVLKRPRIPVSEPEESLRVSLR